MGGLFGDSGGGGQQTVVQAPRPPEQKLQTTGWPGMGPTPVANPYLQTSTPPWATGAFAMPWWGIDAVTGKPLTQQDLMYQAPASRQQSQVQQQQVPSEILSITGYMQDQNLVSQFGAGQAGYEQYLSQFPEYQNGLIAGMNPALIHNFGGSIGREGYAPTTQSSAYNRYANSVTPSA